MPNKTPLIALFVPSLAGGGAERVILDLAASFSNAGIDLHLLVVQNDGVYKEQVPKKIKLICFDVSRPSRAIPKLVRYLRNFTPSVLLSALTHANLAALVSVWIAGTGTRCIVTEHSNLSATLAHMPWLNRCLVPLLINVLYPYADSIVNVSTGVANDLSARCRLPRERMKVIFNPVCKERIKRLAAMKAPHPWLTKMSEPVIIGIGRLVAEKGFDILLQAFAIVNSTRPARLLILGEGDEHSKLEQIIHHLGIEKKVDLVGFNMNPYAYLSHSTVFVFPSRREGLGIALIEALACGVPVVASDCPSGPAEILENGNYGRLVPVGDVQALADALIDALDGRVPSAPPWALERFDPSRITHQYLRILLPKQFDVKNKGQELD